MLRSGNEEVDPFAIEKPFFLLHRGCGDCDFAGRRELLELSVLHGRGFDPGVSLFFARSCLGPFSSLLLCLVSQGKK